MCGASGCPAKGNSSRRACREKLLLHLDYAAEARESILANFKKQAAVADEEVPEEEDGTDGVAGVDSLCEVKLLSKVLQAMEKKESHAAKAPSEDKPDQQSISKPWPASETGAAVDTAFDENHLPPGCKLQTHYPPTASPNVQGMLPDGKTWQGVKSKTRAYRPSGAQLSVEGRATRSFEAAKKQRLLHGFGAGMRLRRTRLQSTRQVHQSAPQSGRGFPKQSRFRKIFAFASIDVTAGVASISVKMQKHIPQHELTMHKLGDVFINASVCPPHDSGSACVAQKKKCVRDHAQVLGRGYRIFNHSKELQRVQSCM